MVGGKLEGMMKTIEELKKTTHCLYIVAEDVNYHTKKLIGALESAVEVIRYSRNELGVPQERYPTPVTNAANKLNDWLKDNGCE